MYTQTLISDTIRNSQLYGQEHLEKMLEVEANGQDITNEKITFIVLHRLIEALIRYYEANYDENGDLRAEPTEACLDSAYYEELMRKLKVITGGKVFAVSDFILATGLWRDVGFWRDTATWRDF